MKQPEDVAVFHRQEASDDIHNAKPPEKEEEKRSVDPSETTSDVGDSYTNWKEKE